MRLPNWNSANFNNSFRTLIFLGVSRISSITCSASRYDWSWFDSLFKILQIFLWFFQSDFWHSALQYHSMRQAKHVFVAGLLQQGRAHWNISNVFIYLSILLFDDYRLFAILSSLWTKQAADQLTLLFFTLFENIAVSSVVHISCPIIQASTKLRKQKEKKSDRKSKDRKDILLRIDSYRLLL
jgi:mRNA deadenylase 3'-5' endonuclease subunit Ccr4